MPQIRVERAELHRNLPAKIRDAFTAKDLYRIELSAGVQLFKLAGASAVSSGQLRSTSAFASPWWFAYEPHRVATPEGSTLLIPGIETDLERARRAQVSLTELTRARAAVNLSWGNPLDHLLIVRLKVGTIALIGRCAHQHRSSHPLEANVFLIGGSLQIYVPALEPASVDVAGFQRLP